MKRSTWSFFMGGLGLGATAMLLLDPARGRTRRARVRDKLVRGVHETEEAIDSGTRDLRNRGVGLVAELRARLSPDEVADDVLVERVRARLGHVVSHPHPITVRAAGGVVTLEGPVLRHEAARLCAAIASVHGVRDVHDELELHDTDEHLPSLQGDERSFRAGGLAPGWRLVATIGGVSLGAYGLLRSGILGALVGIVGVGAVARGIASRPMAGRGGLHEGFGNRPVASA